MPFHPVDVWLNWSVAFSAQGLGPWINDFSVPEDPRRQPGFYTTKTREERFDIKAEQFASEVLASAWLELWAELPRNPESTSPLHWDAWKEGFESNMPMDKFVKDELFKRAILSRNALPFSTPHAAPGDISDIVARGDVLDMIALGDNAARTYHGYRRTLCQVVNALPVRNEFDTCIEQFDITRLDYLTILLYLGTIARSMGKI